jgi:hypothetical protein
MLIITDSILHQHLIIVLGMPFKFCEATIDDCCTGLYV